MQPKPAPNVSAPQPNALLANYREMRARYRLVIRTLITQFKSLYPRRMYRFVPKLIPMKWTDIDPGCPELVYNSMRDVIPFCSLAWEYSGLIRVGSGGRCKRKAISLMYWPLERDPPGNCLIMQGEFSSEEASRVRAKMAHINAVTERYRKLHDDFLTLLEIADGLSGSADLALLGDGLSPSPYAGLPSKKHYRRRKGSVADNVPTKQVLVED